MLSGESKTETRLEVIVPCTAYKVDLRAAFGTCICGAPQAAHSEAARLAESGPLNRRVSQRAQTEVPPVSSEMEFQVFAEELADVARREILPYWRLPISVEEKTESPRANGAVTVANRNAEAAMRRLVESRYSSHGIIGAELGSVRTDAEYCWTLNPISDTDSFISGKPLFATLVALLHYGKPIIGVVDHGILDERWVGTIGVGTTLNCNRVACRGTELLGHATLYSKTPQMFAPGFETERFKAIRNAARHTLYGGDCYAYMLVASGFGADLVVEADLCLYDYAALVPIVSGAGGCISDWFGGELSLQNVNVSKGRVLVTANPRLHSAALGLLCREELPVVGRKRRRLKSLAAAVAPALGGLLGVAIATASLVTVFVSVARARHRRWH